ncbi:hypothetical protein L2719_10150 [Shewanella schlegeliana]|uniref:Lipoprotein n=1 Tax=Shewanella schlegeliana TaxID=190308 RepID=A0ABS1T1U0_9GAMM|nr:hypothetical protein [Shewanella schlegeliana]MBL4914760.1 hypothetical protein [Shewanella schlegeliana]MCL1109908.1 hypothetical protein [Shewanella schlegeliana]GIU25714.1 hypothetical protein TUM4433_10790 [Shewanella schlegeliana]
MKRILVVLLVLQSLTAAGCSSNSVANAGCDFVSGAHRNAEQREQREVIGGNSASANNRDTEVGIINAILGVFTRQVNDDEECL